MNVKLLVIFDSSDGVFVHSHPLFVAVSGLFLLTLVLIVQLVAKVRRLIHCVRLLDNYPVLLVFSILFVSDLAPTLKFLHIFLYKLVKLASFL
jgi:hypothetical protein